MKVADRKALGEWEEFAEAIKKATIVDFTENAVAKEKRIKRLEAHPEEWFVYYFPNYAYAEPADFHKKATKRVLNNPEWYEVRAWSRELAKSTRTMLEVLYLGLTGKKRYVLMISNSWENAARLLAPYKIVLENNQRIINDYGTQEKYGDWADGEFTTRQGFAFRAIGYGTSPRGTRKEEVRPDVVLVDDFDTDEDCRNPDTVDKKWKWLESAAFGTRSISQPLLVIFCGNIIAEYCCITKAIEMADHNDVVNIRDKNGKSSWPTKNSEADIDRVLSVISYATQQGEYFNNPITQGKVFPALHYKKMQPIKDYKFLVAYCDPSYKAGKKNDFKAIPLIGKYKDEYHALQVRCAQTTTANMLDWFYELSKFVDNRVPLYCYIEWPSIDDMFKLELQAANKRHGVTLPLKADERVKPEKFHRIESSLEPLNRLEKLWFNEALKDSAHMKAMEAQFKALSPTSRAHDDGPDAVEGAVFVINSKIVNHAANLLLGKRRPHSKRF